MQSALYKYLK